MKHLVVQVSISAPNDKLSTLVEPNVPSVSERIKCIRALNEEGIYTIVRLQPLFIPWIPEIVEGLFELVSGEFLKCCQEQYR